MALLRALEMPIEELATFETIVDWYSGTDKPLRRSPSHLTTTDMLGIAFRALLLAMPRTARLDQEGFLANKSTGSESG